MRSLVSFLASFLIFTLCCLSAAHCTPSFNNYDSKNIVSIVAAADNCDAGVPSGDDSFGFHFCHFGHSCHCPFSAPKITSFKFFESISSTREGYVFNYDAPNTEGLIKPPIA